MQIFKKKTKKLNDPTGFDYFLVIFLLVFMACIILPFAHMIAVSLSSNKEVISGNVSFWPKGFTLDTYVYLFDDGSFLGAYKNTIFNTVVGTFLSLMTTAMAAYGLSRRRVVGQKLWSLMILITMFFGGGMIPTYLTVIDYGLFNTRWSLILPGLIGTYNLIIMRSFFIAYPKEIIESGELDGLRDPGVFFHLVLPTSKAALATIGLYYAVGYWNAYLNARMYITDKSLYPVGHYLAIMLDSAGKMTNNEGGDEGMRVATQVQYGCIMIASLPIMCVYPFIQKYFIQGVMIGSIKG